MALQLEIITPDKRAFEAEVSTVVLPTPEGEVGILPGHLPLIIRLKPGELKLTRDGVEEHIAVDIGFVKVANDRVSVLTEAAIDVQEIDLEAVEAAAERAAVAIQKAKDDDADPAEYEHFENITRFAIAQRLAKGRRR